MEVEDKVQLAHIAKVPIQHLQRLERRSRYVALVCRPPDMTARQWGREAAEPCGEESEPTSTLPAAGRPLALGARAHSRPDGCESSAAPAQVSHEQGRMGTWWVCCCTSTKW